MKTSPRLGPIVLLTTLGLAAAGLAAWKRSSIEAADEAAAHQPEPSETVSAATAEPREHVATSTSIGTVMALRSITLRNELAGKVAAVTLTPGQIVEEGTVLVAQDVSVEKAELEAEQAQVALAESTLGRLERASRDNGASQLDVDRGRAERDVELAKLARIQAVIERKTLRAPFRARVGLSDVHVGQYLDEGTDLTTLQGVDEAVNVDFTVPQQVAAGLHEGDAVAIEAAAGAPGVSATIVALDSRVDPRTRNARVRARVQGADALPSPGASVRVEVPLGAPRQAVAIPADALRSGPSGESVFVLQADDQGRLRARIRPVVVGAMLGDEVLLVSGLAPGERVAASGSFKLRDGALVALAESAAPAPPAGERP